MSHLLPRPRRKKVAIACDVCRRRKMKCDGVYPECWPCRTRGDPNFRCTWEYNGTGRNIRRLKQRISELENNSSRPSTEPSPSYVRRGHDPSLRRSDYLHPYSYRCADEGSGRTSSQTSSDNPSTVYTVSSPGSTIGFHGLCSSLGAGNFVNSTRRTVAQQKASSTSLTPLSPPFSIAPSDRVSTPRRPLNQGPTPRLSIDICVLPPRSRTDALMAIYWDCVHPIYPFLHRHTLMTQYRGLFSARIADEVDAWLVCTLNLIFALSCQLSTTVGGSERQMHSAEVFLQRALQSLDIWQLPASLKSVQVLLLLAQYLQSANDLGKSWTFVGSAIRMAESLGMHLEATDKKVLRQQEQEVMRRVWHGCVLIERMLAMTHGRSVNRQVISHTPLPLPLDDEELAEDTTLTSRSGKLECFVRSVQLYEILEDILAPFYASQGRNPENLDRVLFQAGGASFLKVGERLTAWEADLPEQFRDVPIHRPGDLSTPFAPVAATTFHQAVVLRQRFLYIRLFSLRPILSSFLSAGAGDANTTGLRAHIMRQCAYLCIEVAQESINVAYTYRNSPWATTGLLATWWHNVSFVYSATNVLVAVQLRPLLDHVFSETQLTDTWQRALEILEGYQTYNDAIPAMISTLKVFRGQGLDQLWEAGGDGFLSNISRDSTNEPVISLQPLSTETLTVDPSEICSAGSADGIY